MHVFGCSHPSRSDMYLRATSHIRLRAHDHYTSSTLIGGKGKAGGPSLLLHITLEGPTEGVCDCKMDVMSTWIRTCHGMDHVSWSLGLCSKTTSREAGLTQNMKAMALRMLITIGLFYFIMCEDPACE